MQSVNSIKQIGNVKSLDRMAASYLTTNINTVSLAQHRGQCRICKHPDRAEIDEAIITLTLSLEDIERYGFSIKTVINHRNAYKLWKGWSDSASMLLFRRAIEYNSPDTPPYLKMELTKQYIQIAGLYKAVDNTKNIQETADMLRQIAFAASSNGSRQLVDNSSIDVIDAKE